MTAIGEREYLATSPYPVAFLGLGVMGFPMAGHLARAGHQVRVFNRTARRAEAWSAEFGGERATTPAATAQGAQWVMMCVGNDDDVRQVVLGQDGALAGMAPGSVLIDHTTASAAVAREIAAAAEACGVGFIDAPVSGGQSGAQNGMLTVMCGGDVGLFERARPLMACYARAVTLLGPVGSGQLAKMVNQICVAGVLQGLSEGLAFGRAAGLDMAQVLEVIRQGAAQSWQMENRGTTMLAGEFDFGFAVDWMRKDLQLVLDESRRNGASLPATALIDQFYADLQKMGGGRWDTSSLIARL